MAIISHEDLPFHEVPRIKTRVLVSDHNGAKQTAVWEQWIESTGYIPLHYHEVEEVLVFLEGEVTLTLIDETTFVKAPATVVVPARVVHGLHPAHSTRVHLLAFFPTADPRIFAPDGQPRPMPWDDTQPRA